MKKFKFLSMVLLEEWYLEELKKFNDHRFDKERFFVYLGEIPNMLGHCVVAGQNSGKIYAGYHIEDFRLPTDEEL